MVKLVVLCMGGCHLLLVQAASGAQQLALVWRLACGSLMWLLWWDVVTVVIQFFRRA